MSDLVMLILGIVIIAVGIVLGVLVRQRIRRGGTAPGAPMGEQPLSTHDEPVEDTARVLDEKRHERSAHDVAEEGRDISRITGGG
jgi:hypothetical protein